MNKNVHVTFLSPAQPLQASSRDFVILSEDSCVPAALGSAILLPRQTNLKNEMVSLFLHFYLPAAGGTQCLKIYVYMAILSELTSETSIAVSFCLQSTERNFSMSWSWRMPIPIPVWKFLEMHKPILEFPMFPGMLTCSQKVVPLPLTEPLMKLPRLPRTPLPQAAFAFAKSLQPPCDPMLAAGLGGKELCVFLETAHAGISK